MPLQTTLSNSFANVLGWKWFYQQQKKKRGKYFLRTKHLIFHHQTKKKSNWNIVKWPHYQHTFELKITLDGNKNLVWYCWMLIFSTECTKFEFAKLNRQTFCFL